MIYTFHGPNRTGRGGARAPARSAVGHDRAAGRARRPERWSAAGSTSRRSCASGRSQKLAPLARAGGRRGDAAHHARRARRISRTAPSTRSSASRSLIAVAGIAIACARLKPAALVPKDAGAGGRRLRARARAQVLRRRDLRRGDRRSRSSAISRGVLWRGIDAGLIDGLLRERQRVPGARPRLGRRATAVRAGRDVRVGAGPRRARRARRLLHQVSHDRLPRRRIGYNAWILPALLHRPDARARCSSGCTAPCARVRRRDAGVR